MMHEHISTKGHAGHASCEKLVHEHVLHVVGLVFLGLALFSLGHISAIERGLADRDQLETGQKISRRTSFDQLVHKSYTMASTPVRTERKDFKLSNWKAPANGGLQNDDYILLAKIYSRADSVFEFGIGESTMLANHLGLPRYVGLESDLSYITIVREKVSSHFRFMWADIGNTDARGRPDDKLLPKNVYSYQIAPLMTEYKAFDVYMVNGSWRLPCMLASFLHASARKMEAKGLTLPLDETFDMHTIVILHDCFQEGHEKVDDSATVDHFLDLIDHSEEHICVFKRKPITSDQDLLDMWMKNYNETG